MLFRLLVEVLMAFFLGQVMNNLAPQYSLYVYTLIVLIFTWEILFALSKTKLVNSYLIRFRKNVGKFMSYLIVALMGASLAIIYWYGIQKTFINKGPSEIPLNAKGDLKSLTNHQLLIVAQNLTTKLREFEEEYKKKEPDYFGKKTRKENVFTEKQKLNSILAYVQKFLI